MFSSDTYQRRRQTLRGIVGTGVALFVGNKETPFNYPSNAYRFRQDSTFLYFFGLAEPELAAIIDFDEGTECLFGNDCTTDDIIWMGAQPSTADKAALSGLSRHAPYSELASVVAKIRAQKRTVHILNPYRGEVAIELAQLLDVPIAKVADAVSEPLIKAVVAMRSAKEAQEIEEIERAMATTRRMHTYVMRNARKGATERQIAGAIEGIALEDGGTISFPVILSMHGEVLHNHNHGGTLETGRLLLTDAGSETAMGYAGDITRTVPVGGRFDARQRMLYDIVLAANRKVIETVRPGVLYRDVHLAASRVIAEGLQQAGLMRGNIDDAVAQGAHTLFFPHGIGHLMGLDVHDMENLGEQYVGYDEHTTRSTQPGLSSLRFARAVQSGFVVTDEPGIYFIPALIDQWEGQGRLTDCINYDAVRHFRSFGGIRIEDDLLITDTGCRVLGQPIPKTVAEIEKFMG